MLEAFGYVLLICATRALPFVAYVGASARFSLRDKALWIASYTAIALAVSALRGPEALGWVALGIGYYVSCACAMPRCALALRGHRVTAGGLFVGLVALYLVVPTLALQSKQYLLFLVLGWELLLSSYSYCRDHEKRQGALPLGACLFFLLVDPTLTFSSRGREASSRAPGMALARIALGALALWSANALLRPASQLVLETQAMFPPLLAPIAYGVLRILTEYAAHSGLASILIGLMLRLGYVVPERYLLPWLARDPADFWRRWNTYVGRWLHQYVFVPVSRRTGTSFSRPARNAVAVLATLLASAALHDGYSHVASRSGDTRFLQFFVACGAAMALWSVASALVARTGLANDAWRRARSTLSRAALGLALIAVAITWG